MKRRRWLLKCKHIDLVRNKAGVIIDLKCHWDHPFCIRPKGAVTGFRENGECIQYEKEDWDEGKD
jgi:hypothetical protein